MMVINLSHLVIPIQVISTHDLKILTSSYKTDVNRVKNRPSGYAAGFFVEDQIFDGSGDLDIHNGGFGKTPGFPNGVYAYFATVGLGTGTNKLEGYIHTL